jgi:pectin methylesterase-like acyl-CoA thioesterase
MRARLVALWLGLTLLSPPAAGALSDASFARATSPHMPSLAAALAPVIPGAFHVRYQPGTVVIEANAWAGVDLAAVQSAVDAAPADTTVVRAKDEKAAIAGADHCLRRAYALVLLDEVNTIRANIAAASLAPRTVIQMNAAIDTKVDVLGCGG